MFMAIFYPAPQISVKSQHLSRLNYKVFLFFIIPSFLAYEKSGGCVFFTAAGKYQKYKNRITLQQLSDS